ncbi:MAG: efflux RND transporter permease subunit, partial [Planctomycetota bacterium]|nr:efflux RND transporter permease subunit [Planctomycetota bacterium]
LPDAASQERTIAVTKRVNDILLETAGIKDVVIINGFSFLDSSRSTNTAGAIVTLEPWEDRSTPELFQEAIVRNVNMKCREIQEALVFALTPPSLPGLGNASGITLQLQDRGGVGAQSLASVATEVATTGNEQSAITGMFTTFRASVPQLFLDIDREQIKTKGIPLQSVFDTLAAYLGSVYVNDFTRFGRIYQVRVQADPSRRSDPAHIEGLQLRSPGGEMIPLGTVMSVNETVGPQTITHFNIYPAARINAQAAPGFSTGQAMDIFEQMAEVSLPPSIGYEWTDVSYQEKAAQGAASVIFLFSILMVYLVLAAQYESWSIPFSVVLAVPTALLGATAGVILGGFDNNVYTQIGIVLLIGLSAKTAILIVEFAKARREEGASIMEAAVDAARLRFRAVLMTAASFILGVIPLLVATGAGAASRRVLGTVVFTGMLAATLIGVIAIPLLYFIIQWISELRRKPVAAA